MPLKPPRAACADRLKIELHQLDRATPLKVRACRLEVHERARHLKFLRLGVFCVFEGTLVIGLILRSLWGLYKIHETLWFYLVSL